MGIEWNDKLSIGVEQVDNEHKELFKRTNALLEACNEGKSGEEVGKTLEFLQQYVKLHFANEERLMQSYNYFGYDKQKSEHEAFIKKLAEIKEEFNNSGGNTLVVIKTNKMLVQWLTNHISILDRKIGEFIKTQNSNF